MRSKNSKKISAYRRGEKLLIFFKRGIIVLSIFVFIAGSVLGVRLLAQSFPVKNIVVSGNYHLDENEIKNIVNIGGESLIRISFDEIETRLKKKAWIKKVFLKKQFPNTILINVEETVPRALLSLKGHLYLIDGRGKVLEEIEDKAMPFLPVIIDINPKKDIGGTLEALKLIDALAKENILSRKESIRIRLKNYGLVMDIDGEIIKVGYGKYSEKIVRWLELEAEIRKRNISINYVDLRFENDVIVKPLKGKRIADAHK